MKGPLCVSSLWKSFLSLSHPHWSLTRATTTTTIDSNDLTNCNSRARARNLSQNSGFGHVLLPKTYKEIWYITLFFSQPSPLVSMLGFHSSRSEMLRSSVRAKTKGSTADQWDCARVCVRARGAGCSFVPSRGASDRHRQAVVESAKQTVARCARALTEVFRSERKRLV